MKADDQDGKKACRIFISAENKADAQVVQVIDLLKAAAQTVTTSPLNPVDDPRWNGWYDHGCKMAIEADDVFVAVVTAGYGASTWMAMEFETAWKLRQATGRPQLFVLNLLGQSLPAGFRRYEEAASPLPFSANEGVARLLAAVTHKAG